MVRRLKPYEKLAPTSKYHRDRTAKDPEWHKKQLKKSKAHYLKNKPKQQIQKKLKVKQQRESIIKQMGSKCMSCGELYNPNLRRSNLQFDHKTYLKSPMTKAETFRQIMDIIDRHEDPLEQFALVCYRCHMVVTHIRKDIEKAPKVLKYIKTTKILEF